MTMPTTTLGDPVRLAAELEFLSQLCQIVASTTDYQTVLDWIVQKSTALLEAEEGSLKLLSEDAGQGALQTMIRRKPTGSDTMDFAVSITVTGWILSKGEPLASADLLSDPRFPGLKPQPTSRVRSLLAAPLRVGNRTTGILCVTHREPGRQWTQSDIQLISIIATHSASVLESARLKQLEIEKLRMEQELIVARETQMALVPSRRIAFGPWSVEGRVLPAREVGGDYFDYFPVSDSRLAVAIADVSGKGMPAALLMSNLQAALRAFATGALPAHEVMARLNHQISRSAAPGKFITCVYGEIDTASGTLTYANAGHNYPLLTRGTGKLELLESGGLPLGVLEDTTYTSETVSLQPGDSLLLYSDGISEAENAEREQFGEERLQALWKGCRELRSEQSLDCLLMEIGTFRGRASQSDDITAVVVSKDRPA